MRKYFFIPAFIILLFSTCSNNKGFTPVFKGSIDSGDWINCNTIGNYPGKTGDHCSRTDSVNPYSFGFSKAVNDISPDPIKSVKVSVWVKMEELDKKCFLVVSLDGKNNKNYLWQGHELNLTVKEKNKWYRIDTEDLFPKNLETEGTYIKIYVWSPNKNVVYVDDYEIKFPKK